MLGITHGTFIGTCFFMYNADMISHSLEETRVIATDLIRTTLTRVSDGEQGATVFALSGDLGSGKTTFSKACAATLGIPEEEITSPTFVIMKMYDISLGKKEGNHGGFKKLIHIDAYRLEKPEEIIRLGWNDLVSNPAHIILVEWPEHIGGAMPAHAQKITFSVVDEHTREISL